MTPHWVDIGLVVAIVVAGCGASYLFLLAKLRGVLAENHREMDRRFAALTEAILSKTQVSEESGTDALAATEMDAMTPAVSANIMVRAAGASAEPAAHEEIPGQIQAAIAAAAIAALGNHARVRSARSIPSSDVVSPWTQQGRVIVQSSHNLRNQG